MSHPIQTAPCQTFHLTKHTLGSKYARHSRLGNWDLLCWAHIIRHELFCVQYLILNLLGLSQNFYFYLGFPTQLLVLKQPYRQKKQRNLRGLERRKSKGIGMWMQLMWTGFWETWGRAAMRYFCFPSVVLTTLRGHLVKRREKNTFILISPVLSVLFEEESGGLGGLPFTPFSYKTLVRQILFWSSCVLPCDVIVWDNNDTAESADSTC